MTGNKVGKSSKGGSGEGRGAHPDAPVWRQTTVDVSSQAAKKGSQVPEKIEGGLYLSGLCEHSHGIGEGQSFSMLALRGDAILKSILERQAAHHASFEQAPSGEQVSA